MGNLTINKYASLNFYYAKFFAILVVATGHYFEGSLLWIPATVCLFIFGFSSGYFTAGKNDKNLNIHQFWLAKIRRLGPTLIVVSTFLAVVFAFEGRTGIVSWHSLISIVGMSGFLDWFAVKNLSPFGNGLWFLTVLWLFYMLYPVLAVSCKTKMGAWISLGLSFLICTAGNFYASPPYALWPTVFSFVFGVFIRRVEWSPKPLISILLAIFVAIVMFGFNIAGVKLINYYLLIMMSILVVGFLLSNNSCLLKNYGQLSAVGCVFEIYLIHSYLFIRTDFVVVGYVGSLIVILVAAYLLNLMASSITSYLGHRWPNANPLSGEK